MAHVDIALYPEMTILSTCTLHRSKDKEVGEIGSLILDRGGLVFKCSAAAARIFGGMTSEIEGLAICKLITDLMPGDTSREFNANYLTQRCNKPWWSRFEATNLSQQRFPVELTISGIAADDGDFFLIHLHQAAFA